MAIQTTTRGFHYPDLTGVDTPDVPRDIKALADDIDDQFIAVTSLPAFGKVGRRAYVTTDGSEWLDVGTAWVQTKDGTKQFGKSIIAATETRSNAAYGLLATPDRVQGIVLPTDGLLAVWYHALWSAATAPPFASIFIGANQLKIGKTNTAPVPQAAATPLSAGNGFKCHLSSCIFGLVSNNESTGSDATDLTTGQVVGAAPFTGDFLESETTTTPGSAQSLPANLPLGGPCYIFAAAGTYDISVQFKVGAGSVSVSNRKLWVRALNFG